MEASYTLRMLESRLADLERRVSGVADVQDIEKLQNQYGYYLDTCLYEEVVDLFDKEPEVRFLRGIYRGQAGIRHARLCHYERGWAYSPIWEDYVSACHPEDPDGPDEIDAEAWSMWPDTSVLPFHYEHPVTGRRVRPATGSAPP